MTLCISVGDGIQIVVTIITAIGLFLTFDANKNQLRIYNHQLKLNFFTDYTKRYQEIILNFPESINEDNFSFELLDKPVRDKTFRYMRAYFDLCSEEYHLNQKEHIDSDVWEVWEWGIKYAISKSAIKIAW